MATKALNTNQHRPLHILYPDNCCLCKAEKRIKELEEEIEKLRLELNKNEAKSY